MRFLRRNDSKATDKLAAINSVFDGFVNHCLECYAVGENCTIDITLERFRDQYSFRQQCSCSFLLCYFAMKNVKLF